MIKLPLKISDILVDLDDTISPFNGKDYFWDGLIQMLIEKFEISSLEAKNRIAEYTREDKSLEDPNNIYRLCVKFGISPDELWNRSMRYLGKNSFHYPDAVEMVKTMHARYFRLHLATNRFGLWLDTRLAAAGLGDKNGSKYFNHYFTSKHGYGCKLDNDYYSKILTALEVPSDNVLMIGDSLEQDLYNANKAGIKNVVIIDRAQQKKMVLTDAIYLNSLSLLSEILECKWDAAVI